MRNSSPVNVRQVVCYRICAYNKPTALGLLECRCRRQTIWSILEHQHGAALIFLAQQLNQLWSRSREIKPAHLQMFLERRVKLQQPYRLRTAGTEKRSFSRIHEMGLQEI